MNTKVGFIFAVMLVISAVSYYFYNNSKNTVISQPSAIRQDGVLSAVDTVNENNVSGGETVQDIEIEGGSFYFKPNEIRVKAGEKVKITFKNIEGFHDLIIDDLSVKTKQIRDGEVDVVEFTPTLPGSYEFYCSIGNHRSMGMKGILIVE